MTKKHIGCPDGSTIVISHRGENIVISIEDTEASLSLEGVERLVDHLNTIVQTKPEVKDDKPFPYDDEPPSTVTPRATLLDLVQEGLVRVGTELTLTSYGTTHYATVTNAGLFDINGHMEMTPSGACQHVIGRACNGWKLWRVKNGPALDDLRWKLRASWFPVKGQRNTLSASQKQQRMIVTEWVDHALHRGLNPDSCNERNQRIYLDKRQRDAGQPYKDKTLDSYRRYLRQWCEWCRDNKW